jgi:hypothetical protein
MTMKRTTIAKTLIAIVTLLAPGIALKAQAQDGCSNSSLNGSFAYKATGTLTAPQPNPGQIAIVGRSTFDGNGATGGSQIVSSNGFIFPVNLSGTYQVNPDCTGTFSFQLAPGVTINFFFVIDDNRKELQIIQTDPGAIVTGTARKQ